MTGNIKGHVKLTLEQKEREEKRGVRGEKKRKEGVGGERREGRGGGRGGGKGKRRRKEVERQRRKKMMEGIYSFTLTDSEVNPL